MASEKNYDPPMHSAEHILNQTMMRLFGSNRSFSNHIEKKKSKCDYVFSRPLLDNELLLLEEKINEVVASDLEVTTCYMTKDEASKLFDLSRLPADAEDPLRIVKIGDYDACPCIGPHVGRTSEIGEVKIISSDFNEGVLRIRFKRMVV